jgi:hypothetical protein
MIEKRWTVGLASEWVNNPDWILPLQSVAVDAKVNTGTVTANSET